MPDALTVLLWVASVSLALITVLCVVFLAALIAAALEVRALARGVRDEVRQFGEYRRYLVYRTRFAGKWLKHMSRRFMR